MAVTEAAIGAAGAIAGAGVSAAGQSSLNKKTREFNAEQARIQREWSEQMYEKQNAWNYERWLEENAYNSPSAQVARLREAGLNPLYYGLDGTGNAGDITAAQPLGYERANMPNMVNPFGVLGDTALKVAQIANIQANTAKTGEETLSEVQRREKITAEIENTKQELNNLRATEGLTNAQRKQIDKNIAWLDRINEANVAEKESAAKLNDAQRNRIEQLLEGEKILQVKTAEDFDYKWQKVRAEIGKMSKETGILEKDIENYALNHASNGFMGTGLSFQNLFRGVKGIHPTKGSSNYYDENSDVSDIINSGQ